MAGNKEVTQLPLVPDPNGSAVYAVKTGVDYQAPVGGANGLAYTDAGAKVPLTLIPSLPASQITSGTFTTARIPSLDTAKITTGTFLNARIAATNVTQHQAALSIGWGQLTGVPLTFTPSAHAHAATDVTTGTFANARIAVGNVTQHQAALSVVWTQLTAIPDFATRWPSWTEVTAKPTTFTPSAHVHAAADVTTGVFLDARIPSLDASKITSGVFPIARLATGIPNGTKFVRDDGVLAVPATTATAWGSITGTLSSQTDLQTALNGKAATAHTHAAADVTSGIFADARIPSLDAAKTTTGTFVDARIPNLATTKITSGTFADARIAQTNVTQHQAALGTTTSTANVLVRRDASADIFGRKFVGQGGSFDTTGIDLAEDTSETAITKGLRFNSLNGIQGWAGTISIIINSNAHLFGPTSYNSPGTIKGRLQTTTANIATTLNASHLNQIIEKSNTTAYTYTLAASLGVAGDVITVFNSGTAGDITIARDAGVALYKGTTNANITVTPGTTANLIRSATTNRWIAT